MNAKIVEKLRAENKELKKELVVIKDNEIQYKNQILTYQNKLEHYQEKCQRFEEEYDNLLQAIKNANRDKYGPKSERFVDTEQQRLFDFGNNLVKEDKKEAEELITYTRLKRGSKKPDRESIPTREVIIPAENRICECGSEKKLISYETSEKLNYQPAKFEILIQKREVLGCPKGCEKSMTTADAPKQALPKVKATEELLSYITATKVLDRQPLYHLEKKFEQRYFWKIPRQTMARWLIQMSWVLQPLVNLMKDEIIGYDIASADATPLQVLKEPGRPAQRSSYAYCIRGGPPERRVILFEYNAKDHKEYLKDTMTGFSGKIHVDADNVFDGLTEEGNIKLSYCHAHARRKFEQIAKTAKKAGIAKEAVKKYQQIYSIERQAKDENLMPEQRYELRKEKTGPLLEEFKAWLDDKSMKTLPKSPLGKAISYSLNNWAGLLEFLNDGRLEIDNNATEREIKTFVIARKNFLFADSMAGADALGVHFSLVLTAKSHGLKPYDYYVAVLKALPYCNKFDDYEKLLPWNLKAQLNNL